MRPLALRTIVVAVDATDDRLSPALRTAAQLAQLAGAKLFIVSATDEPDESAEPVKAQLRRAGVAADAADEIIVRIGPPGAVVGQEARRLEADVVFLGPHRGDGDSLVGSTADRVVHIAGTPCLILPLELPLPLQRVLTPVDSSDGARGALAVALTWASALRPRTNTAEVIVLQVSSRPDLGPAACEALEAEVDLVRKQLASVARVDIRTLIKSGDDTAATILQCARDESTELLVIGTRRTSMSTAAMLGSVSSAVARNSGCPVLLVPPEVWTSTD